MAIALWILLPLPVVHLALRRRRGGLVLGLEKWRATGRPIPVPELALGGDRRSR